LQRLFSTFPNSWPGVGLLLLRLCLGVALIYCGVSGLLGTPSELSGAMVDLMASAGGVFLLAGFWTPVMGALAALAEVGTAIMLYPARQQSTWDHIFLAVLCASLAMLGPGAWSIDARLFGRRRIEIGPRSRRPYL
jgi:putative oxidoreductase